MIILVWIVGALIALVVMLAVAKAIGESITELRVSRRTAATRRIEVVDGNSYTAITRPLSLLREKRTGRMCLLMERGWVNVPNTIDGRLVFEPQWVRVQFIRTSNGKLGRSQWRDFTKFGRVGEVNVDFLRRRVGWFSTETMVRYPAELGHRPTDL